MIKRKGEHMDGKNQNLEYKTPIIGFVIVQSWTVNGDTFINAIPMEFFERCLDAGVSVIDTGLIDPDDKIIGVIPANHKSVIIRKEGESGDEFVRYEL